jgi:hypothetical protein
MASAEKDSIDHKKNSRSFVLSTSIKKMNGGSAAESPLKPPI